MKAKELKPIFSILTNKMPGFVGHKPMLLLSPMQGLLRAVHFDSSAFDKFVFNPATLVMPLCVPSDDLSLLFGHRLRNRASGWGWSMNMPDLVAELSEAIQGQAIPFLSRASTLLDFVELAQAFSGNPHTPKKIAFALARAGETERAITGIDAYLPKLDLSVSWHRTIADQSTTLRDLLKKDPDAAQAKLDEWENYTVEKLGLQAFR